MTQISNLPPLEPRLWPSQPGWAAAGRPVDLEEAAFRSGAALTHLQMVMAQPGLPTALWRDRLALEAAAANARHAGRTEGASELRDALHLARSGDPVGPAGEIAKAWRRAVVRPPTVLALEPELPGVASEQVARCCAQQPPPVAQAAQVLEMTLAHAPRGETAALILADAALARACGWNRLVPLLSTGLGPRDLRETGTPLRLSCHRAVGQSCSHAAILAQDLTRRADRLRRLTPKLRAKGAGAAVEMFLSNDALAPVALTSLMSDRAARRLCDRLVSLGALRELTGRASFRLYGL